MNVQIEDSWKRRLQPEFDKEYFKTLTDFVRTEYQNGTVYPPGKLIFNAFNLSLLSGRTPTTDRDRHTASASR